MPKTPPVPPSEEHHAEQIPPTRRPGIRPDPAPDSLGQEGEQSNIKRNTADKGRRQDRY